MSPSAGQTMQTGPGVAHVCTTDVQHVCVPPLSCSLRSSSRFIPVNGELLETRRGLAPLPLVLDSPARLFISNKGMMLPPHPPAHPRSCERFMTECCVSER